MTNDELIEKFENENLTLAPLQKRGLAYLIDEMLVSVLFSIIYLDQLPEQSSLESVIVAMNGLLMYLIILKTLYQTFFLWMYGATLGRIAMKIEVISVSDLEKPTFFVALNRSLFRIISESLFYLGFLWAYLNPTRETWHDKIAATLVIDAR